MPTGSQEGLDINAAVVVEQGLNTLASENSATEGQVPTVGSDGRVSFGGVIQKAKVVLTDAQIKALPTTPVEIVPAPGPGLSVWPVLPVVLRGSIVVDYGNVNPGAKWGLAVGDNNSGTAFFLNFVTSQRPGALLAANDQGYSPLPLQWLSALSSSQEAEAAQTVEDQPLVFVLNPAGGNLSDGDPANTLAVTVLYTVVALD